MGTRAIILWTAERNARRMRRRCWWWEWQAQGRAGEGLIIIIIIIQRECQWLYVWVRLLLVVFVTRKADCNWMDIPLQQTDICASIVTRLVRIVICVHSLSGQPADIILLSTTARTDMANGAWNAHTSWPQLACLVYSIVVLHWMNIHI